MIFRVRNEDNRQIWLKRRLLEVPKGSRILDAGAGELRNRRHCAHLTYVSQDFGQYTGAGEQSGGLHSNWDSRSVDLLCDIQSIPEANASFDAILCSEVLEHVPEPTKALDEFARLLRSGGALILTAPFSSLVHMAPYHYCAGFSRYWYEYHLPIRDFEIAELTPNGDWYSLCEQELQRLGAMVRRSGHWSWPLAYSLGLLGTAYFKVRGGGSASDLACFGWHCVAHKR